MPTVKSLAMWDYKEVAFPICHWVLVISMMAHLLPTAGVAPSCDWLSQTSYKCPLCTGRSFPRVPSLSPEPLAQGSCYWPGGTRAHQSVEIQAHHHTRPRAHKDQQDVNMTASPKCLGLDSYLLGAECRAVYDYFTNALLMANHFAIWNKNCSSSMSSARLKVNQ